MQSCAALQGSARHLSEFVLASVGQPLTYLRPEITNAWRQLSQEEAVQLQPQYDLLKRFGAKIVRERNAVACVCFQEIQANSKHHKQTPQTQRKKGVAKQMQMDGQRGLRVSWDNIDELMDLPQHPTLNP